MTRITIILFALLFIAAGIEQTRTGLGSTTYNEKTGVAAKAATPRPPPAARQ